MVRATFLTHVLIFYVHYLLIVQPLGSCDLSFAVGAKVLYFI